MYCGRNSSRHCTAASLLLLSVVTLCVLHPPVEAQSQRDVRDGGETDKGVHVQAAMQYLQRLSSGVSCTSQVASKRSCMYHNVCLLFGDYSSGSQSASSNVLTAVRLGGRSALSASNIDALLQQQLSSVLSSFGKVQVFAPADSKAAETLGKGNAVATTAMNLWNSAVATAASGQQGNVTLAIHHMQHVRGTSDSTSAVLVQDGLVALLQSAPHEYSLGHALGNCALPVYLMLRNHLRHAEDIPVHTQLVFSTQAWGHPLLPQVLRATLAHNVRVLGEWLGSHKQAGTAGVCFRNLVLGDGGYMGTSMETLGSMSEAQHFTERPTFFSSTNWQDFKRHAFRVSGIMPDLMMTPKPLIVLNDKRYNKGGKITDDKRMILDIEDLAGNIQAAYPNSDVVVVRFRDFSLVDQMRFMAAAKVFITTAGSSSHLLVFMPAGSTAIVLGGPEDADTKAAPPWVRFNSFNELDRWFPLSYVNFERYTVDINDTASYAVKRNPEVVAASWQPGDEQEQRRWWNYNADIRMSMQRLRPMLNNALGLS